MISLSYKDQIKAIVLETAFRGNNAVLVPLIMEYARENFFSRFSQTHQTCSHSFKEGSGDKNVYLGSDEPNQLLVTEECEDDQETLLGIYLLAMRWYLPLRETVEIDVTRTVLSHNHLYTVYYGKIMRYWRIEQDGSPLPQPAPSLDFFRKPALRDESVSSLAWDERRSELAIIGHAGQMAFYPPALDSQPTIFDLGIRPLFAKRISETAVIAVTERSAFICNLDGKQKPSAESVYEAATLIADNRILVLLEKKNGGTFITMISVPALTLIKSEKAPFFKTFLTVPFAEEVGLALHPVGLRGISGDSAIKNEELGLVARDNVFYFANAIWCIHDNESTVPRLVAYEPTSK